MPIITNNRKGKIMKKIVLFIIGLIALFSILRVNAEDVVQSHFVVHPGYLELANGTSNVRVAFGFLDTSKDKERRWNLFPMYISMQSGKNRIQLSLNGLSILKRTGISVGRNIIIKGTHKGDVISVGGKVSIYGKVKGDVWVLGSDILVKKGAVIEGSAIALGGKVLTEKGSRVKGNKQSVPDLKIPFLHFLTGDKSARNFRLIIEFFRIALFMILLFIILLLWRRSVTGTVMVLEERWKNILLFVLFGIFTIPIITVLLGVSIVGIFFIPVFFLALGILVYFGFVSFSVRLGMWVRNLAKQDLGFLYSSGLLGFLFFEIPFLLGIVLGFSKSSAFLINTGNILKTASMFFYIAAFVYGLGGVLEYLRDKNSLES